MKQLYIKSHDFFKFINKCQGGMRMGLHGFYASNNFYRFICCGYSILKYALTQQNKCQLAKKYRLCSQSIFCINCSIWQHIVLCVFKEGKQCLLCYIFILGNNFKNSNSLS
ncbi:unnamed protein product [Meganyctiphanes norvegica]|uniref:Transmembrane protein n=1 Tax=Meganyctiphanes norvegica TaxID=48144 RepID=A0AAV2RTR5_MEGNR